MKKIMKPFVLVAAAAMALASCQKNEISAPEKQDVHFTINAGIETKTSIADNGDGTYSPSWKNGDQIGIFFTEPEVKVEKVDATFSNTKVDGPVASFEGTATVEGQGTFYAFYPKSAFNQHYGDETIRLDLSAVQKPTSTSFDPACDILVAKPCDYLADGETVVINDLYFARLISVLKINLKGEFAQGEIVESLTFSVDGVDITGNAKVDYKNATITAWNNGNVDRNVVTASYAEDRYITIAEGNNAAYLVVAPTTIPAGTSLSFTLKTANYNISKTVSAPSDMTFTAGNLSVLNLTIKEENCEAIVADTRIWVEGFDEETTNKTQTSASKSGVAGTGVSNELTYAYSESNCNVRINNNGQTSTNPFLYINAANASFTASKIKIANEENLALSAMVKGEGLKLTVEYKESASSTWSSAGKITGTSSFAQGRVIFAVPTTATSLDIRLTGNGVMYVDDIVLESTDEEVPVVTLMSIAISNQKTEYYVGDDFVKPTVTAAYSDETTKDVTGLATFSECDMNTVGNKTVTVTYEGKSAEYNFTVKEKGASSETVEWVATSFADLKAGDEVVIVGTKSSAKYAMSNDKGTSDPPIPVSVTVSNDKLIAEPANNIIWYVGVDGSNRVFNANEDGSTWLYCTNTNNGVRVGTNTAKTFTLANGYLKHVDTGRYLGIYNTQDWRCYTSTTTNIANQTFQFFVKSGNAGGETPDPEEPETPAGPVQLSAPVVQCSASDVTENSLKFTWGAIENASKYEVTFNNGTPTVTTNNYYTATGLDANTKYTISVKAVGDGVNYTTSEAGTAEGTTKEAQQSGGEAESVVVLSEQFDNSTKSDSNSEITTSKFPNFSGITSKAYTSQYGGIKLGSSKASGYITSKSLDLSSSFTVQIDACKYGSDTGNITVTVGSVTKTINNSELGAQGTFKTFTLNFDAATANSTVKIATSSKRAYIDNVVITRN